MPFVARPGRLLLFVGLCLLLLAIACRKDDDLVDIPEPAENRAPELLSDTIATAVADSLFTYQFQVADADGDSVSVVLDAFPAWLDFNDAARVLSGTPGREDVGEYKVQLQLSDGEAVVDKSLEITVVEPPENQPPVLLSPTETTVLADSLFYYVLEFEDPDGDSVLVSLNGVPDWLTYDAAGRVLSGAPDYTQGGDYTVLIRFTDGQYQETANLKITVLTPFYFEQHLRTALENGYNQYTAELPGVSVAVVRSDGALTTTAVGSRHFALDEPIAPHHQYRIASITKTFTAALIIRMAEEGHLDLDDRLIYHLQIEGLEYSPLITIRQLLSHTAGVFDHLNSDVFWNSPLNTSTKVWTNDEIFQFAVDQGAYFIPGMGYAYSNTGIYILGAVAEAILEQPLAELYEEWIFEPLQLEETFYDDFSSESNPIPDLALSSRAYDYHLSAVGAAGAIVSSPRDVAKFGQALYGGGFIQDTYRDQMLENLGAVFGGSDYGLCTRIWNDLGIYHYGHTGSLMEYRNILMFVHDKQAAIAIHTNAAHENWFDLVNYILAEVEAVL